ncbi:phosphotransferase [Riemerella anatipestifer]|nr:phosphotransferase [Riemerella anatipestifer]
MSFQSVKQFFETHLGNPAQHFEALPASGSARVNYVGISHTGEKYIITYNENSRENEAFFYFSSLFSDLKLNTPQLLKISEDRTTYIQTHLGDHTLSEVISKEGLSDRVKFLVKETLTALYHFQQSTLNQIDYSKTFEYEAYDDLPITHDLYYFKNFLVDTLELHYHKSTLLKEFKEIVKRIERIEPRGLMIRDFQSRNIMVNASDKVFFIDYQSAMEGPLIYDVISMLYQAKANFPEDFRQEMLDFYFNLYTDKETQTQLKNGVELIKLIRFMQVLGAYGFRGLIQRKAHFIESLHQGIDNLYQFSEQWDEMPNFPELKQVIKQLKTADFQL